MATQRKKLSKKAKAALRTDVIAAVALVSILINLFFFSGVFLFSATNELDVPLYEASVEKLCFDNYSENLTQQLEEAKNPTAAKANFEIACRSGEFQRYHDNAVEAYLSSVE